MTNIKINYRPYILKFKFPAGTSRGTLHDKLTYFIRIQSLENPEIVAFGEVPFFQGLSAESQDELEKQLQALCRISDLEDLKDFEACSSLTFGLEMAIDDFRNGGKGVFFTSDFLTDGSKIPINGLIWMGNFSEMKLRVDEKLKEGFNCIKIKIGAVDWQDELALIDYLRANSPEDTTIRLDANGAFSPEECLGKLEQLDRYNIHSIEQPIKAGNWTEMKRICENSPIPVALDEELIGIPVSSRRKELLEFIKPAYIVLKPALCYGFWGAYHWITLAEDLGLDWWFTSALESNVGLDALAQFASRFSLRRPQGLGTGNLYLNNFPSPLLLQGEDLRFKGPSDIFRDSLQSLFRQ